MFMTCSGGEFGPVCATTMNSLEALVICRGLGFLSLLSFEKKETKIPSHTRYTSIHCHSPSDRVDQCTILGPALP